nr:hypothetical protein [Acidimicrobiia bacterium]
MDGPGDHVRRHGPTALLHLGAIGAAVFLVRVLGAGWFDGYPVFFPDSSSFAAVAERGPFTGRFWFDQRPIGFPLLMSLFGAGDVRTIVVVQSLLYVGAFAALLIVVVKAMGTWPARIVGVLWIAALAAQPRFALWNTHVLSESTSLTAGIAAIAAWWWFGRAPTVRRTWVAVGATVWWLLTRDSDVVPYAAVVAPAMLMASWRWRSGATDVRRALRAGAVVGLAVCAYLSVSQDVSDRNIYPVINNVGQRILPDAAMTSWFEDRGLPLDDELRSHTGRHAFDDDLALLEDPALAEFRAWAAGAGQRWQVISFVVKAPFWLGEMGADLGPLLATDHAAYDEFGVTRHLPSAVLGIDGPRSTRQLWCWSAGAAVAVALALRGRRLRVLGVVTGVALAASFVDLYLSYVGDSLEVGRHLVGPLSRLSVSLVLAVALG